MALFSHPEGDTENGWIARVNPIPLLDVMLVLVIIFLVTIAMLGTSVPVNFPGISNQVQGTGSTYVVISVDKAGNLYLNDKFAPNIQALSSQLQGIASRNPQPELYIRAHAQAQYADIGQVIDTAQGHGFSEIQLITRPAQK